MIIDYIKSDLCRHVGFERLNIKSFIRHYMFNSCFKYLFWFRLCQCNNLFIRYLAIFQHRRLGKKYLIDIPAQTKIGFGFYLGHGQSVVINKKTIIGNNVNLSQFTSIGANNGLGAKLADNIYIGPSVSIVENVKIGTNVKIGAGTIVIKDVPCSTTVVGNPGRVVNYTDEDNPYVNNRWPEWKIKGKKSV